MSARLSRQIVSSASSATVSASWRVSLLRTQQRLFSRAAALHQEQQSQQQQENEQQQNNENGSGEPKDENQAKIEELEIKVKELEKKYLMSLADMENTRRIAKLDVDKAKKFSISSFAKNLLEVADNLERALSVVDLDVVRAEIKDEKLNKKLGSVFQGIKMTQGIMNRVLAGNGVEKMPSPMGRRFDPKYHDALMKQPLPDKEPGTVFHVISEGYMIGDRVLRPSQVGVVVDENGEAPDVVEEEQTQEGEEKKQE